MNNIECSNPRIYLDGKDIGELKNIDFYTNIGTIYADVNTDEILENIKQFSGQATFTGTCTMSPEAKKMLFPRQVFLVAQNKSQIKRFKNNFKHTNESFLGTQLIIVTIPTKETEKYLKRMRNRIKKEKRGRSV